MFSILQNLLASFYEITSGNSCENQSLRFVHVIFRHGNRTNISSTSYKNDPYKYEEFYPYGPGQLTKQGKLSAYKMGREIKRRYSSYLGDKYLPHTVIGLSSSKCRAKTSLLCAFAGMFPPTKDEIFEKSLRWQPIPYSVPCEDQDLIFFKLISPGFKQAYCNLTKRPETRACLNKYYHVFEYISEHTGEDMRTIANAFLLYNGLLVEKELGLELPEWTCKVFPDPLHEMALLFYVECTDTLPMRKITVGHLLKHMVNGMKAKIDGKLHRNTKMVMYSGHDVQVMNFLATVGYSNLEIPPYSAYVLIELHEIEGVYGVKVFYQHYKCTKPCAIKIKGKEFCPLSEFICSVQDSFPEDPCVWS